MNKFYKKIKYDFIAILNRFFPQKMFVTKGQMKPKADWRTVDSPKK